MSFGKNMARFLALIFLLLSAGAFAQLVNPGFEKTFQVPEKDGESKKLTCAGWKFEEPLFFPEGWKTNPGAFKNGEYRIVSGSENVRSGEKCVYLRGHLSHNKAIDVAAGDEIEVAFYARDPGRKPAGICFYFYERNEKGKITSFAGSKQLNTTTSPEWELKNVVMKIPQDNQGRRVNSTIIALVSQTGAYFDDISLSHRKTASWLNFGDAYFEGRKKAAAGNYEGSRADFMSALGLTEKKDERIKALTGVYETYVSEKDFKSAVGTLKLIIGNEKPDSRLNLDLHLKMADAYSMAKEYDLARGVLETVLEMGGEADEEKVGAQFKIADLWLREKKYDSAIDSYRKISGMKQSSPVDGIRAQFRTGEAFVLMKDLAGARTAYSGIPSMRGASLVDRFDANRRIGDLCRSEKNHAGAREFYEKALGVDDVNDWEKAALLATVAETYESDGMLEEARKAYGKILEMGSKPWNNKKIAYSKIGALYRKQGEYEKERETYRKMLDWISNDISRLSYGGETEIYLVLSQMLKLTGDSYFAEGKTAEAREYYLRFLEIGRVAINNNHIKEVESKIGLNDASSLIRKAEDLFAKESYPGAISEYGNVISSPDANPRQKALALDRMGDVYTKTNNYVQAREKYAQSLKIIGVSPEKKAETLFRMGDSYAMEKKYAEARSEYFLILAMAGIPDEMKIEAREKTAESFRAECEYEKAREEYGKMLEMKGLSGRKKEEIRERIISIYR